VEGAALEDGKGQSIWDVFMHTPGRSVHGDTGDIAADHYHLYPDDIAMMRAMNLNAYRFSISWPRVFPEGAGPVNHKGLDHYSRVVDALLAAGITPMVTLYHWDLPQALEEKGGWLARDTSARFADYAAAVVGRLGDRVRLWLTLNEPWTAAFVGYARGDHAPGVADYVSAGKVSHHMLLAHGLGLGAIRSLGMKGVEVGLTLSTAWIDPWSTDPRDERAALLFDGEQNRVFLDPVFKGRYPDDMMDVLPVLKDPSVVRDGDLSVISSPLDFLGLNFYITALGKADSEVPWLRARMVMPEGPHNTAGLAPHPANLGRMLERVRREYTEIPIYITEVGYSSADYVNPEGVVNDPDRVAYLQEAFRSAARAVENGVDLRGIFVWSLLDNLEWEKGYSVRFGLVFVDYGTQRRIIKQSGRWYAELIASSRS
jgi:beta-glucosidase